MPIRNKYRVDCIDCFKPVAVGAGLSEKRSVLNLPGHGWATRHFKCSFTPPQGASRPPSPPRRVGVFVSDMDDPLFEDMTESDFFGDIGDK